MEKITLDDLRRMNDSEGLILQGCGGDLNEWVTGINELFTEEGILLDGDTFKDVSVFENDGHINLLFKMDNIKLNVGKLAMWKLQTTQNFGGYWLSDYVPNRLGGFIKDRPQEQGKPRCPMIGADGNIFNILGLAGKTLRNNGMGDKVDEMLERAKAPGNDYHMALGVVMQYVEPVGTDEPSDLYGPNPEGLDKEFDPNEVFDPGYGQRME